MLESHGTLSSCRDWRLKWQKWFLLERDLPVLIGTKRHNHLERYLPFVLDVSFFCDVVKTLGPHETLSACRF